MKKEMKRLQSQKKSLLASASAKMQRGQPLRATEASIWLDSRGVSLLPSRLVAWAKRGKIPAYQIFEHSPFEFDAGTIRGLLRFGRTNAKR